MTSTVLRWSAIGTLAPLLAGCGLLDVSDPTAIEESDIANAEGADLMRRYALAQLAEGIGYAALYGGILSDELMVDASSQDIAAGVRSDYELLDRRSDLPSLGENLSFGYGTLQQARVDAGTALDQLRAYAPAAAADAHVGQMMAARAYGTLVLAEVYCAGFPLKALADGRPEFGTPVSTDEALQRAVAEFDSAVVHSADSTRILNFVQVGRARALLALGRFADAAAAAATVPTDFLYHGEFYVTVNPVHWTILTRSVADHAGLNGVDFVSAEDPRLQLIYLGKASDSETDLFAPAKYPTYSSPIVLASGIEARLIEAEAALMAGDPSWLALLNELRATQVTPAPDALSEPDADAARVDLLFRERAFWLFATGHRVGDLRRLIAHYGRDAEDVFPTGAYRLGDTYGTASAVPFPVEAEARYVPEVTGCLDG